MKHEPFIQIESILCDIPNGSLVLEQHTDDHQGSNLITEQFESQTSGKGKLEIYPVFPGILLSLDWFLADQVSFRHGANRHILEITHCRFGRIGWNFKSGTSVYLGSGDLSLHSTDCCADSVMTFPLGYCEGISIFINLKELSLHMPPILRDIMLDPDLLYRWFCLPETPAVLPSGPDIDVIFRPLYGLPEQLRMPYFKLKVQELLLYLYRLSPEISAPAQVQSRQAALMQEIHHQLTEHLDRRYTIEELSRQYLINTSSLKEIFKGVYGMPIATYMKEFRIRKAMELLQQTDDSIAEIAAKVGYETQGKFAKTFKEFTNLTPSSYRKKYREGNFIQQKRTDV